MRSPTFSIPLLVAKGRRPRASTLRMTFVALVAMVAVVASIPARAAVEETRTVAVSTPDWFFSPGNWHVNGSDFAETQNPGAYFVIGFTGSHVALALDVSMLSGVPAAEWPRIRWQIDGGTPEDH